MTAHNRFLSLVAPPEQVETPAWWFIFQNSRLLISLEEHQAQLPQMLAVEPFIGHPVRQHYLGTLDGTHCFAAEVAEDVAAPDGWRFQGLRRMLALMPESLFWLSGRALQIIDWDRSETYCGRCGQRNQAMERERAKKCPDCCLASYPRISPAIIVLVHWDEKLLLARSHRHPPGRFSVLAGFVDPGETLEQAVAREVKEEVGLDVKEIRYFGSQPWPFPNSLMVAFTCKYAEGEIALEEAEMAEAGWYSVDDLPRIPPLPTISRQMINWFVSRQSTAGELRSW